MAFDLDGTLIDADAVDEFAKLAGKGKQATDIRKKAMDGKLKPEEALVKRVKLLKGMECEELKEAVEKLPLMKGARKATKELMNRGVKVCIISGGFEIVAERVKKELGLYYAVGNELVVKAGKLTGEMKGPTLKEGSKGKILAQFAKRVGVPLYECAVVENGVNDVSMLKKANLKIAFNPRSSLNKISDVIIEEKDLTRILPHVLGEADVEVLRRDREGRRMRIDQLKKDISQKRNSIRDIGNKKRDIINAIRITNAEANKLKASRDEFNAKVKATKAERDKANDEVRAQLTDFRAIQEKVPTGDFKKLLKEVRTLEWNLQTRVIEIKKEDAIVEKINKLRQELEEYRDLIKL
ncbi:MAG: phosphoserine phosphatase SerB, partial [Candidatus Hydrothermarchaeota archaeon]|nr:phosphoserine phosphatase SerB [Candidatus Hydrothermarchaeota archaeon]